MKVYILVFLIFAQFVSLCASIFFASINRNLLSKNILYKLCLEIVLICVALILYFGKPHVGSLIKLFAVIPLLSLALYCLLYSLLLFLRVRVYAVIIGYIIIFTSYYGLLLSNLFIEALAPVIRKFFITILLRVNPVVYLLYGVFDIDFLHNRFFYDNLLIAKYYFYSYPGIGNILFLIAIFVFSGVFLSLIKGQVKLNPLSFSKEQQS